MKEKNIFTKYSIRIIELYQKYLSPDHSPIGKSKYPFWYCRYHPTCSEYSKQAIEKYWFFKWWTKSIYRILRCNPCSKWWVDEV